MEQVNWLYSDIESVQGKLRGEAQCRKTAVCLLIVLLVHAFWLSFRWKCHCRCHCDSTVLGVIFACIFSSSLKMRVIVVIPVIYMHV